MATLWSMHAVNMLDDDKVRALYALGGWGAVELWREIIGYNTEFRARGKIPPTDFSPRFLAKRMLANGEKLANVRKWLKAVADVKLIVPDPEVPGGQLIAAAKKWEPKRSAGRMAAKRDRDRDDHETTVTCASQAVTSSVTSSVTSDAHVTPHISESDSEVQIQDISGDARSRAERIPEDAPDGDRIAALLLSKGMFDWHPRPGAKCALVAQQVIAWGGGFEEAGELWEHVERTFDTPRKVFGWALKDAGKWKAARAKVPQKPVGPGVLAEAFGRLGAAFAMRSAMGKPTRWESVGGGWSS